MTERKITPDAEALGVDAQEISITATDMKQEVGEWVMACRHREKLMKHLAGKLAKLIGEVAGRLEEIRILTANLAESESAREKAEGELTDALDRLSRKPRDGKE